MDSSISDKASVNITVVSAIILSIISQRTASFLSDQITNAGLDGRIEILIIIIVISVMSQKIYVICDYQSRVFLVSEKVKIWKEGISKIKESNIILLKSRDKNSIENVIKNHTTLIKIMLDKAQSIYLLSKHFYYFIILFVNILEFFAYMTVWLVTSYVEKFFKVYIDLFNISMFSALLFLIPFFLYTISMKTEYLSMKNIQSQNSIEEEESLTTSAFSIINGA